jgi:hypothetical protein
LLMLRIVPGSAVLPIVLLAGGCLISAPKPSRVDELLKHPQFIAAAQHAPHFTGAALKAVADAENQR